MTNMFSKFGKDSYNYLGVLKICIPCYENFGHNQISGSPISESWFWGFTVQINSVVSLPHWIKLQSTNLLTIR